MKCPNCKTEMHESDYDYKCSYCGTSLFKIPENSPNETENTKSEPPTIFQNTSFSFLLGLILPFVGFIIYFVWKKTQPNAAKSALKGAFISSAFLALTLISVLVLIFSKNNTTNIIDTLTNIFQFFHLNRFFCALKFHLN